MEGGRRRSHRQAFRSKREFGSRGSSHKQERKVNPTIDYKLRKIAREAQEKNDEAVDEYLKNNNLTDLVSPYLYDNVQMNILKYILGSNNADAIAGLNALNYAGIINTDCPPPKEPWKTESYKNILTGKLECREPIPRRKPLGEVNEQKVCPEPNGDPMAIQKYVDMYGNAHCIRPVVSGQFSCPPKNDPTKTKLKVLKNNVGVCVEDPMLSRKKKNLMPSQLVYPNKIDPDAVKYLEVYNSERLTLDQIAYLSNILRKSRNLKELGDIKAGLSGDRHYESLVLILDNIHRKNDINLAQSALGCYLRDYLKENKSDIDVKELLKVSGLEDSLRHGY